MANFIIYKVIDTLSSNFKAGETFENYSRCFNKLYPANWLNNWDAFDVENDIFEIRHDSDGVSLDKSHGTSIHVTIIDVGTRKDLLFGLNGNLDSILIDSPAVSIYQPIDGNYCHEDREAAASIKIKNGVIIKSKCEVKKAVLMLTFANNPMVIGYDGKFHLFALFTFY